MKKPYNKTILAGMCIVVLFLFFSPLVNAQNTMLPAYVKIDGCAGIKSISISGFFTGFCCNHYLRGKVTYSRYLVLIFAVLYHGRLLGNLCFLNNYFPIQGTYDVKNSKLTISGDSKITLFGFSRIVTCWASAYIS